MPIADLEGPFDDFRGRATQIKSIVVAIESASRSPGVLTTTRAVDLNLIGAQTGNTANAMSLVFLASSFEEFVREEINQCASYLADKYADFGSDTRHQIRNRYWGAAYDNLKFASTILTKTKPKTPDASKLNTLRLNIESVQGFVVNDDATLSDPKIFSTHARNFKPDVVDELALRLGIKEFVTDSADNAKIKAHFGVTRKADAANRLRAKLNEFYDRRNQTVHSLSGVTGFGSDVILDYLELFEATAESMKHVLSREIAKW
jgi:hypothetical protein